MSEIGSTQKPEFNQQESPSRVTPTSTTSDQGAHQQAPNEQARRGEKPAEPAKQVLHHDPAVTLSASLVHLQAGSSFIARIEGRDGESRPVIATDKGTYVVQTLPDLEEALAKLPPDTKAAVQITAVDKEITATLTPVRTEKHTGLEERIFRPTEVTLTLVNVNSNLLPGAGPSSLSTPADQGVHYQASNLYKAEQIARNISGPIEQIPLPTVTRSYTFFEPGKTEKPENTAPGQPAAAAKVSAGLSRSVIGAPIIAQETATPAPAASPLNIQQPGLEQLLQKPVFATVIKTYPKPDTPLPAFVQKEIALVSPLDNIPKGSNFTLSVQSVAIPNDDSAIPTQVGPAATKPPAATAQAAIAESAAIAAGLKSAPEKQQTAPQQAPSPSEPPTPANQARPHQTPPGEAISGIIVDPRNAPRLGPAPDGTVSQPGTAQTKTSPYAPLAQATAALKTYYLATPASVVKFESSADLPPGTIVTFAITPQAGLEMPGGPQATQPLQHAEQTATTSSAAPETPPPSPSGQAAPPATTPTIPAPLADIPPQPLLEMLDNWESLSLAMSTLVAQQTAAATAISQRIPNLQAPQQMTAGILFFMAALGSPNPAQAWLGQEVVQQLQRAGQERLIQQMDTDMRRISTLRTDAPTGDWRPVLLPLQTGPEITALPMLIRHVGDENRKQRPRGGEEDSPGEQDKATRFMLELDLKGTGNTVLDGMLRQKRLDIILKTEKSLAAQVKEQLTGLFTHSLQNSDFEGELVFQDGRKPEFSVRKLVETKLHFSGTASQKA